MKKLLSLLMLTVILSSTALAQENYRYWYNFSTGKYEARLTAPSQDEMSQFLPQIPAAQGLYAVYLAMGKDHVEASILVLKEVTK